MTLRLSSHQNFGRDFANSKENIVSKFNILIFQISFQEDSIDTNEYCSGTVTTIIVLGGKTR